VHDALVVAEPEHLVMVDLVQRFGVLVGLAVVAAAVEHVLQETENTLVIVVPVAWWRIEYLSAMHDNGK
jgi:hypothetical protein